MKLAIMQPYFLPYIGYFQLIAAADVFVVYDNIKYTKKGWINRNRFLQNGTDAPFSLPIRKDSDHLDVVERQIAAEFDPEKLLNRFKGAYGRAPHFRQTIQLLEEILFFDDPNLFRFIEHSLAVLCRHFDIRTTVHASSTIPIDHELKAQDKVIALCKALKADIYINPMGGIALYDGSTFSVHGITLNFIQPKPFEYPQFGNEFVPWLSIVDVLMFNPLNSIRDAIAGNHEIIQAPSARKATP